MGPDLSNSTAAPEQLSELRRAEITREEAFRQEIRAQSQARPTKGFRAKSWAFLNSSLGLWFLSSILLSGVGFAYTSWQTSTAKDRQLAAEVREADRARQRAVSKLDLEISFRLSNLVKYLDDLNDYDPGNEGSPARAMTITPAALKKILTIPPYDAYKSNAPVTNLYAEHERSTLIGLLAELTRLESERSAELKAGQSREAAENQRIVVEALQEVTGDLSDPERLFNRMLQQFPRGEEKKGFRPMQLEEYGPVDPRLMAKSIQVNLILPRWREANFSYLDCSPGPDLELFEPFC